MAIMRAGVTHWHAGLIESAHGLICRAYAILLITHGAHHAITKDLEVKHQLHWWLMCARCVPDVECYRGESR